MKHSFYWKTIIVLMVIIAFFNLLACSRSFCDAYADTVYGVIADVGGKMMNGLPVAVGELLMYLGILLIIFAVIFVVLLLFLWKKQGYRRFVAGYMKGLLCIILIMLVIYTLNWVIPFRSSVLGKVEYNDLRGYVTGAYGNDTLSGSLSGQAEEDVLQGDEMEQAENDEFQKIVFGQAENNELKDDGLVQAENDEFQKNVFGQIENNEQQGGGLEQIEKRLRYIRNDIVEHVNALSDVVERDEEGAVIYPDKDEVEREVADAMRGISDEFPRLSGFYPRLKIALCSELLEYMWIGGYTYPYTMEVTGNRYTDQLYYISLYAHESAHHQGYYRESEANFLAYLGCVKSEDPLLQYSGYISIYYYIDDACVNILSELNDDALWDEYDRMQVADQVRADELGSLSQSVEEFQNAEKLLESFEQVAEDTADIGWETQGEILDEDSYDGVVDLLLKYYEGKLY